MTQPVVPVARTPRYRDRTWAPIVALYLCLLCLLAGSALVLEAVWP